MARLGDICRFQSGGTPPKNEASYFDGPIPWITTVALNGATIDGTSAVEWITEKAIQESAAKIVPANSVLVGTRVGVGKAAINSVPMSTSQDIISLIDIDESEWSKKYICKFILAKSAFLNEQARGATIKGIKIEVLANLSLPSVTLEQQNAASVAIDTVDELISLRRKQLQKLDDLVKSRFVEMFGSTRNNEKGWKMRCFEEITDVITDGEHATPKRVKQGLYLLSARNILDHTLQLNDVDYIDHEEYERIAKRITPQAGDVLISCSGSVGRCCCIPEGLKLQMVRSVALLRFKKEVNPLFAEHMITSDGLQEQINASKTASSQANLFQGKIAKLKGFIPPLALQNEFVTFVKQVDTTRLTLQNGLNKMELLKQSLMQKYFG